MKADKVIFGNIYTVDRKQPKAGAAAIDGGKFIYVGDEATTLNEAYQLLCDDRLGSITVGKEADLVVLAEDITACDPEQIADTKVLRTMVCGEWVYIN
jgi:predicted amidohydrolase YtcJ